MSVRECSWYHLLVCGVVVGVGKRCPPGPYCFQLTLPFTNSNAPESGSFSYLSSTAELTILTKGQVNPSQNMSIIYLSLPLFYMVAWLEE